MKNNGIENGNILLTIRSIYPSLTKAEKKVADVVLEESQTIMYGTLTDLAEKANVGETSVLRFCRSIKYRGFQEFKIALAQTVTPELEGSDNQPTSLIQTINHKNMQLIQDTSTLLNEQDLEKVTSYLLKANKIVFFGVGSSGATAQNANFRFSRLGLPVEYITDSHLGSIKAALLNKNSIMIVISVSGSTVDSVDIARIASENGAKVVCITSHAKSPAAKYSDVVLLSASREKPTEGSAFSSIISQLHILDVLFDFTYKEMGISAEKAMQLTAKATSQKLY